MGCSPVYPPPPQFGCAPLWGQHKDKEPYLFGTLFFAKIKRIFHSWELRKLWCLYHVNPNFALYETAWWQRQKTTMECQYTSTRVHGVTSQTTASRISDLKCFRQLESCECIWVGYAPLFQRKEGLLGEGNPTFTHSFNDNVSLTATGTGRTI